jgi:hypothetical protein
VRLYDEGAGVMGLPQDLLPHIDLGVASSFAPPVAPRDDNRVVIVSCGDGRVSRTFVLCVSIENMILIY